MTQQLLPTPKYFSELVELFLADVCAGKTNETPQTYRTKLAPLVKFWPGKVQTFGERDFRQYKTWLLSQKYSIFYVRGLLQTAKHLLRWAHEAMYLNTNLGEKVKLPKLPELDPKPIDNDTFEKLLTAATMTGNLWSQVRSLALLYMLRDTGARAGELLSAQMADLDMEMGKLLVRGKGARHRYIYLTTRTRAAVAQWLLARSNLGAQDKTVFVGRAGRKLSRSGLENWAKRLRKVAGVTEERSNLHAFRHAFARDFLQNGGDLARLSQILGHSSVAITAAYYARFADAELKNAHTQFAPGGVVCMSKRERQSEMWR